MKSQADPQGSMWRRWDPHIHTPGTAMNNQFGHDAWDEYLRRIETSEPLIEALGITDYCSVDEYENVRSHQAEGRLPEVGLLFPNVELRLPTATGRDHPVNIHLLVSPEDPNHIVEARRFLRTLKFQYGREVYSCEREDLIRLGRAHDQSLADETAALRGGTNLFKVTLENLKDSLDRSDWAQRNVIVGVAGGSTDGSSGIRDGGGSLEAVRVEIERMARVIFASSPAQRLFWIGEGVTSAEELARRYDGLKPCLHGSDAHRLEDVGVPAESRFTWIKGDATFEALRQACLDPKERVIVAPASPEGALPYRVIDAVTVVGADWVTTPQLTLAPGLVAIIGARGSGKTALADMIAAGAAAASQDDADQTFLQRARHHLAGASVKLRWGDGQATHADLPPGVPDPDEMPRVQYLSQQFVERLCSSEGITDELLAEVERVIFEAHPFEQRIGASDFRELLDLRASQGRELRRYAQEQIDSIAEQIETERTARAGIPALETERDKLRKALADDKTARGGIVVAGGEERARRLEAINDALATRQTTVDALRRRETALSDLVAAVSDIRSRRLPEMRAELERKHPGAELTQDEWVEFTVGFVTDPAALLTGKIATVRTEIEALTGSVPAKPTQSAEQLPPYIAVDADLEQAPLNLLRAESWRLGQLIGLDANRQRQLEALNGKISTTEAALTAVERSMATAKGATARINALMRTRKEAYASLFDGFMSEQHQLTEMYSPLESLLGAQEGALGKLTFSVRRVVNVEAWARWGESLLDLRTGEFRGRGELLRVAREVLLPAWETGASNEVAEAMARFRADHDQHFMAQAKATRSDAAAYKKWASGVSAWLNSTEHISVQYGVQYDGVNIEQLSPGTRGIVLLLLYLAVDQSDDRPLIIDQPEENLDPKSIFVELVGRFIETRRRRQVIIVTHNANLVVNTDVDQVIVAEAGAHRPGRLPEITYRSGGLENAEIRGLVCEILEGGRRAFEERARRLRIRLS